MGNPRATVVLAFPRPCGFGRGEFQPLARSNAQLIIANSTTPRILRQVTTVSESWSRLIPALHSPALGLESRRKWSGDSPLLIEKHHGSPQLKTEKGRARSG